MLFIKNDSESQRKQQSVIIKRCVFFDGTYMVNLVGKARVSPLSPRWVLAKGVATVFSAPARIIRKKECLVDSETTSIKTVSALQRCFKNNKVPGCERLEPTWLVGDGANEVRLERQPQLLQGDGALGGRRAGRFCSRRGLLLALWVSSQTVQLCLQRFPPLR